MTKSEALRLRGVIETAVQSLDDQAALTVVQLYPAWAPGAEYAAGHRIRYGGFLWCVRAGKGHTSQTGWEPENAASLWRRIDEDHTGTADDPIPYGSGMELELGLYYSQDGAVYRCAVGSGAPVYHSLSELVGIYVEVV